MPISFGIPLGQGTYVIGAIIFYVTDYKRAANILLSAGAIITILTVILIVLAAISPM